MFQIYFELAGMYAIFARNEVSCINTAISILSALVGILQIFSQYYCSEKISDSF